MKYTIRLDDASATVTHDEVDEKKASDILAEALSTLRGGDAVMIVVEAS